ncbi:MAG: NUDIX domain-containing protein [Clostridia bacterium]|nr:NUDIX domain-containing protein [Clostridia bacterium]
MMAVEKWDILNERGIPTGKTTLRGRCHFKNGEYHLVVHIWIVSSRGEYLIQRRADNKKLMPGEWAATGGAAISGETSFLAAKRELFEELGLPSSEDSLIKLMRIKRRTSLLDVWAITADVSVEELVLQKSEVAEAKWVSKEQLSTMIKNGQFHNYGNEYFDSLFEKIDDYRGAFV